MKEVMTYGGPFLFRYALSREKFFLAVILSACSSQGIQSSQKEVSFEGLRNFTTRGLYLPNAEPGCQEMLNSYCDVLYAPESSGNLLITKHDKEQEPFLVLQGNTDNNFPATYYEYSRSVLHNRYHLPHEFSNSLEEHDYFEKLRGFLKRKPRKVMSLAERIKSTHARYELQALWDASIEETILKRLEKKFKNFHTIPDSLVPVEMDIERRRIKRVLESEIATDIWQNHPNWKRLQHNFEDLRMHYVGVLERLDIPAPIQQRWIEKIKSVRLVLPGSMPEIANEDCASTQINAFYYPSSNVLTVCAGDFNSEDIMETVAHELSHSIDVDTSLYDFEKSGAFGQGLAHLREEVCEGHGFNCDQWSRFKNQYASNLSSLSAFKPDVPEFQRCLKRRPLSEVPQLGTLDRIAGSAVSDSMADLAVTDYFLRITKEEIPLENGSTEKNPNYLNPCNYYLWTHGNEPIDDELTTLIFFTAEYRCRQDPDTARLKASLELARDMSVKLVSQVLHLEGEFSPRKQMEVEKIGSSPVERFADVMGSYALADYLQRMPATSDRRNLFLASSSWQCVKPSLSKRFPEESSVENEFILDNHMDGDERKREFFSSPVREVLNCKKDFQFNECSLPFKPSDSPAL